MKKFNMITLVVVFTLIVSGLTGPMTVLAATAVSLGTADNFAVLAYSGITFGGAVSTTNITGDIGSYSTPTITGIENVVLDGTNHAGDGVTQGAKTDLTTAYGVAQGSVPATTIVGDLGTFLGGTLTPGVYNSASSIGLTGTVTLDGGGDPNAVFIFQAGSTLITAEASSVVLTNSTQACNVFWQVGSSATLGASSIFKGNILALTSIGLGTTADVNGRVLARNGAVTFDGSNTVTKAVCATTTTDVATTPVSRIYNSVTVIKQVINDNGGTATYSNFPLFVNGKPVQSGESKKLWPGIYTVTETSSAKYKTTFSGDCDASGKINHGGIGTQNDVCLIVNDDIGAPVVVPPVPPIIDIVKVPSPLALPNGAGPVTYNYTVKNIGTVAMTNVTLVGDTCSPIVLVSGDTNGDSKLDVNEVWVYNCSTTLTETHTNTVVAMGWANGLSATDIAHATVLVGTPVVPPLIHITKIPSPLTLLAGGGSVTYTKKVTNPGTVALSNVTVKDDKCSAVNYISGDTNNDLKLDTNETWTYTCQTNLTKTTVNTATAKGEANGLVARDFAIATVTVADVVPKLPATGLPSEGQRIPWHIVLLFGAIIAGSASLVMVMKKSKI